MSDTRDNLLRDQQERWEDGYCSECGWDMEDGHSIHCSQYRGTYYVNVYETGRRYGGPEEGGWWYDTGWPVESIYCSNRDEAMRVLAERQERIKDWSPDHSVILQSHFAVRFPQEVPQYE